MTYAVMRRTFTISPACSRLPGRSEKPIPQVADAEEELDDDALEPREALSPVDGRRVLGEGVLECLPMVGGKAPW